MNTVPRCFVIASLFCCTIVTGCGEPNVDFVTFGAGLPAQATIVARKPAEAFAQDAHEYIIFDTDATGVETFASAYAGVSLAAFARDRTKLKGATRSGTWADTVSGIPWDLTTITDGRFYRRGDTNGFVAIDMDLYRVYVFR
ncbi:hypothetical protein U8335_27110 [Roseiconus lacunae]|uniref:hypothetical protein n=1 Tax=Roseiconus lacunae TaxID=2605694 RepID=UPI0030901743|nr:hypothetical protein U8335_27110 [Stieleria sp. HD01]